MECEGQEHVVLLRGAAEGCSLFGDFRKGIIAGSMAFYMGWGLVFSYKLLCPRTVRTLFEGVQQSLFPGVKGLSSVVVLLPGYACLSVEIFLQFPWQEQRVTHIPWGDISTFFMILQASVTFPKSSCWSLRFKPLHHPGQYPSRGNLALQPSAVNTLTSWCAQCGSGILAQNPKTHSGNLSLSAQWHHVQHFSFL